MKPWQNIDWTLLMLVIGMTVWGSLMIRSVELNQGWAEWWQHLITGLIGLVLAMVIARNRYDRLLQRYWWIYGITNVGLLTVMFLGTEALGAQRWISIAGFNLQPSEFA
ncbi:MAG: FtsW/RodA/SpoVE family cell cycle protein, partial [Synechococcales cyanobacterium]